MVEINLMPEQLRDLRIRRWRTLVCVGLIVGTIGFCLSSYYLLGCQMRTVTGKIAVLEQQRADLGKIVLRREALLSAGAQFEGMEQVLDEIVAGPGWAVIVERVAGCAPDDVVLLSLVCDRGMVRIVGRAGSLAGVAALMSGMERYYNSVTVSFDQGFTGEKGKETIGFMVQAGSGGGGDR